MEFDFFRQFERGDGMNNLKAGVSRRQFVGGSSAIAASAALSGLFAAPSMAKAAISGPFSGAGISKQTYPLFVYHCKLVHKAMGDKLTRIVTDPAISEFDTNLALRTTRCPCCDTQIHPGFSVGAGKVAVYV